MSNTATAQVKAEEHTFFCQVETFLATKDYLRGGRCVRLVGVDEADFNRLRQNQHEGGVSTFLIDIDRPWFLRKLDSRLWKMEPEMHTQKLCYLEESLGEHPIWFKVSVEANKEGDSYFYRTFSAALPTFFKVKKVEQVPAPVLTLAAKSEECLLGFMAATEAAQPTDQPMPDFLELSFSAFHVGQGMCSAVHDSRYGVLFDAGAGKPVTRERYQAGLPKNELMKMVDEFDYIPYLVLSHFDYDHWKLLAWDKDLRDKIEKVIVPDVASRTSRAVAFFDSEIVRKVAKTEAFRLPLGSKLEVLGRRSSPAFSDSNGECLVCVVDLDGKRALVPGDYVYARMRADRDPTIASWASGPYAAVIVPHHGDEESALHVPSCTAGARAFFSAGTHQTWKHPTPVSINNHKVRGFVDVANNKETNIVRKVLL